MRNTLKKIAKRTFILFSKYTVGFLFDRKYLRGRWFDGSVTGWKWAWRSLFTQKIGRRNARIPWPVSPYIVISNPNNIVFDPDDINDFQGFGNYYQNFSAKIIIGKETWIAPNVGIITANHDPYDLDKHLPGKDVIIGKHCWIGMNAVILPGVVLGDHTIVGAGAVVTKSFPEGYCVIAGNPARKIKDLDKERFRKTKEEKE